MQTAKQRRTAFILLLPWIITLAVFWVYPLCYALWLSFNRYHTLNGSAEWIGLENYRNVFSDRIFLKALLNTGIFTAGTVPVTTSLALVLAAVLNTKFVRFKNFFRATYFLPTVTSVVVISLIFTNLYAKDGYINSLASMLHLPFPSRGWLLEPSTALLSVMAMDVWMSVGYYTVLLLAAMQTISGDLYEAAELSGASAATQFFRITIPLLKPTLLFVLVINTIKSFQVFVEIYVMTKGGPLEGTTTTLVYEVYRNAFEKSDGMGYASAMAFIILAILLLFSALQMRLLGTKEK